MVVMTPTTKPAPTLAEKLEMLKSYKGQHLREQNNMMLDALGVPAVDGRCPPPCQAGDCIMQDGLCYKARVCSVPNDIWCSKGVGQCGSADTKQTCGSGADKTPCPINYEKGWVLPQGCKATCMVSTVLLRGEQKCSFRLFRKCLFRRRRSDVQRCSRSRRDSHARVLVRRDSHARVCPVSVLSTFRARVSCPDFFLSCACHRMRVRRGMDKQGAPARCTSTNAARYSLVCIHICCFLVSL